MTPSATDQHGECPVTADIHVDQVGEMTQDLFGSMLGLPIESRELDTDPHPDQDALMASIQITGDWQADVHVVASEKLAETIACTMFGLSPTELAREELLDAVCEVVNIIGGNVKGTIGQECLLSLPTVSTFADRPEPVSCSCTYVSDEQPFMVFVCQK